MKFLQIIPKEGVDLKNELKTIENDLRSRGRGTFYKVSVGKWKHVKFWGWLRFEKSLGGVLNVEIKSKTEGEWQIFSAFIGFLDRSIGDKIHSINIQYK